MLIYLLQINKHCLPARQVFARIPSEPKYLSMKNLEKQVTFSRKIGRPIKCNLLLIK